MVGSLREGIKAKGKEGLELRMEGRQGAICHSAWTEQSLGKRGQRQRQDFFGYCHIGPVLETMNLIH